MPGPIYLDYASTTPVDKRVLNKMTQFFSRRFGNPSSIHFFGAEAKKAVADARAKVARALEAKPNEIVFTSGGTESNNLAISGVIGHAKEFYKFKPHIITTNIEHSSVLEPLRELERRDEIEVSYIGVAESGVIKPEDITKAIKKNTILISVMYANNEIGTIQPIRKISRSLNNLDFKRPIFHVDACQAPLYLNCFVNALGVDLFSIDGHKIYGPKGVGCLYARNGVKITPIFFGGGQESGLRSTTENVSGIVGIAEALSIAVSERENESRRIAGLRDLLRAELLKKIGPAKFVENGVGGEKLPNNLNISFFGIDTEMLVLRMDSEGVLASTKSSCLKGERESYVIKAICKDEERARSSLRLTLGRLTKRAEVVKAARLIASAVLNMQ